MRKLLLGCILATSITQAQVGIGTTSPQEELHIAGETSTIRIDGLNSTNNPKNNGLDTSLSVNGSGTIILSNPPKILGRVNSDGSPDFIEGSTSSRIGLGVYRVVFNNPMTENKYIVLLTGLELLGLTPTLTSFNTTVNGFDVYISDDFFRANGRFDRVDGVDLEFMFKVEPVN